MRIQIEIREWLKKLIQRGMMESRKVVEWEDRKGGQRSGFAV
jgi:hypothetical protein